MAATLFQILIHSLDGRRISVPMPVARWQDLRVAEVMGVVEDALGLPSAHQVLTVHGKPLRHQDDISRILQSWTMENSLSHGLPAEMVLDVHVGLRICGGKGGFGSLLRAKRARKKTSNFGSARMLDGRRLRDVQLDARVAEADKARAVLDERERQVREASRTERQQQIEAAERRFQDTRRTIVERVHSAVEEVRHFIDFSLLACDRGIENLSSLRLLLPFSSFSLPSHRR